MSLGAIVGVEAAGNYGGVHHLKYLGFSLSEIARGLQHETYCLKHALVSDRDVR